MKVGKSHFVRFTFAAVFAAMAGLVWAQKPSGPRRPTPVVRPPDVSQGVSERYVSVPYSVTPANITFTSSTPDSTQTNATTVVSFRVRGRPASFHVYALAGAARFTGCNTPPAGSVTVACNTPVGVTCAGSAPLTNTGNGTTVATGTGSHNPASFHATYTFQDDWSNQVGTGCTLNVSYIYTEP